MDENGFMLGGDFIKEKAKEIAKELDINDHKFSDGWLHSMQGFQGISMQGCHGEKRSNWL